MTRGDELFQRLFVGFYRVRRDLHWRRAFFELLERAKHHGTTYADTLSALGEATGRLEASFASKLFATVDPHMPAIDSIVLKNLGLRLPDYSAQNRERKLIELHESMRLLYREHVATRAGRDLVVRFRDRFPDADITEGKMLDLTGRAGCRSATGARSCRRPGRRAGGRASARRE